MAPPCDDDERRGGGDEGEGGEDRGLGTLQGPVVAVRLVLHDEL